MSLLTLGILAVLCIILIIIGGYVINDYELTGGAFLFVGIIGAIFIVIGGFGFHAIYNYNTMYVEKIKPDTVLKSNTKAYAEIDDTVLIFSVKKDYDLLNDSITFYKVTYYNYYGCNKKTIYSFSDKFKNVEIGKEIENVIE